VDNTPNYANSPVEQKPSRKKTIWLVIIILALIASNTGWALFYLKQQGELTAQINTLKAQNIKLTKDNKDLQSKDDSVDTTVYREIPELGVKYKVTDQTKDLTYTYLADGTVRIGFSTVALTDAGCDSSGMAAGAIARYKAGDMNATGNGDTPIEKVKDAKKIGNYYYLYAAPQSVCSDNQKSQELQGPAKLSASKAFDTLVEN
jgi:hypothetical protein